MSTTSRTWETAGVVVNDSPARSALTKVEAAVRSRVAGESRIDAIFRYVLLLYLFLFVSRAPELAPFLRIGILMMPILLIGMVMTSRTGVLLETRRGRWLIGFTVWVAVCVPFSFWPGGSFQVMLRTAQSLVLVAFILAFVRSVRDVMQALTVCGLASGAIAVVSFLSTSYIDNRQVLGGSGSLGDPNFYALYLIVGLPLLCLTASQGRGWLRLCSIALIPIVLAGIVRSGSRGGLIALLAGLIMFWVHGTQKQRTVLLSTCLLGVLLSAVFLPKSIKVRFTSWFAPSGVSVLVTGQRKAEFDADLGENNAQSSTEARMYLLRRSLEFTFKHPLFGVGPDMFQEADGLDAKSHGVNGIWHVTHNTYTQMSSEVGIPGFILFAAALFGSYRGLAAIRRRGPTRHIRQVAFFLQLAYVMLMVGAFFLSLGYGGLPFVLIGLSEAFKLAVRRHVKESSPRMLQPEASLAV
jgi:O-antigen ligase